MREQDDLWYLEAYSMGEHVTQRLEISFDKDLPSLNLLHGLEFLINVNIRDNYVYLPSRHSSVLKCLPVISFCSSYIHWTQYFRLPRSFWAVRNTTCRNVYTPLFPEL